jgi:membrane protease YdiL (CAAX protease family)
MPYHALVKPYALAGLSMLIAVTAQWLSLFVLKSLAASFLFYSLVSCIALPLASAFLHRKPGGNGFLERLGLKPFGRREALAGLGIGAVFGALIWLAFLVAGKSFLQGSQADRVVRLWGVPRGPLALLYVGGLVMNGAIEEIFWRGHLHALLAGSKPRWLAVGIPALVFGGQHIFVMSALVESPAALALMMAGIIAAGIAWGILYERFRRLSISLLSHAVVAASYVGILYFYVFS